MRVTVYYLYYLICDLSLTSELSMENERRISFSGHNVLLDCKN